MGKGFSPQSVHAYRSVRSGFMVTSVSPKRAWVQVSVHIGLMGTGVSPQSVHGYGFQSKGDS